jgi:SAM-dependent methyltransferase
MIPSRRVFEDYAGDYDQWFDEHPDTWQEQQQMLRKALPNHGRGLEMGVGSGWFAVPFGIRYGIDPSRELARMAMRRGIEVVRGEGELLPYRSGTFDYVLMMTVICFLDDVPAVFHEVYRVLKEGGTLVAGFIERGGEIQREYCGEPTKGRFLQFAKFRTAENVERFFKGAGFARIAGMERAHGFCVMAGRKQ